MTFEPEDLLATAHQLVDLAKNRGVTLRILGHLAVRTHVQENRELIDALERKPTHDIDFLGYSSETSKANRFFIDELGYKPDPMVAYSQEFGLKRLIYHHDNGLMVEIFQDDLVMSHTIHFKKRLELDSPTISLVDLVLSKLQIHEINEKDIQDIIVLLIEHDLGSGDKELIDVDYMVKRFSDDWGFYYTATTNLKKVLHFAKQYEVLNGGQRLAVEDRIGAILEAIEHAPKSIKWKLRAKVGTRKKWYQDVREVWD